MMGWVFGLGWISNGFLDICNTISVEHSMAWYSIRVMRRRMNDWILIA